MNLLGVSHDSTISPTNQEIQNFVTYRSDFQIALAFAFSLPGHELSIRQRPLHSRKKPVSLHEESLASRDSHRFDDKVR
jgi:hypothetical protein